MDIFRLRELLKMSCMDRNELRTDGLESEAAISRLLAGRWSPCEATDVRAVFTAMRVATLLEEMGILLEDSGSSQVSEDDAQVLLGQATSNAESERRLQQARAENCDGSSPDWWTEFRDRHPGPSPVSWLDAASVAELWLRRSASVSQEKMLLTSDALQEAVHRYLTAIGHVRGDLSAWFPTPTLNREKLVAALTSVGFHFVARGNNGQYERWKHRDAGKHDQSVIVPLDKTAFDYATMMESAVAAAIRQGATAVSLAAAVEYPDSEVLLGSAWRDLHVASRSCSALLSTFGDLGLEPDARCDAETWSLVTAAGLALDVAHKALRRESDEMSAREETSTDVAA